MRGIFIVLFAINVIYGLQALLFNKAWLDNDVQNDDLSEVYKDSAELRLLSDPTFSDRGMTKRADHKGMTTSRVDSLCTTIGPFIEMDQLREFERRWLTKKGVKIKISEFQNNGKDEFVLKIDLQGNSGDALDALNVIQKLKAVGLDGYVMIEPSARAIIIGPFNSHNQASLADEKVQLLDYNVEIKKQKLLRKQFWIKVGNEFNFIELRSFLEKNGHELDGIILSQSLCE